MFFAVYMILWSIAKFLYRRLTSQERQECLVFAGLIPLLFADLRKQWSNTLFCTDASPDGYGVCCREVERSTAESLGRWNERWRFKRLGPDNWGPRRRALGRDPLVEGSTVVGDDGEYDSIKQVGLNEDFPEVPLDVVDSSHWRTVLMGKWRQKEAITVNEGRALVLCLRRLCRSSRSRGLKHVVLVDSFSLALAVHKGRARSFDILRITQQVAALSIAGGFSVRLRWIASEHNVADGPSRGQIEPGPYRPGDRETVKTECEEDAVESGEGDCSTFKAGGEKPQSNQSKSRSLKGATVSMKSPPAPRRKVGRIPALLEDDVGSRAQKGRLTVLEERSVSAEVQSQYRAYYEKFENFCRVSRLGWPLKREVDLILADFLDVMFLENHSAAEGEKVVAATEFFNLHLKGTLFHCKRALRGWRKEKPAQSRLPLPRMIAAGMAMILCAWGKRLMSLKLMVDHDTYLRPGESIDLKGRDIVPPVRNGGRQYRWFAIVVRDSQDHKPDKTGVFDNSVPLNSVGREYLGQLLWERVLVLNGKDEKVYPFDAAEFRKNFQEAGQLLGFKNLHPYQSRHGGASEDLNSGERDHLAVKVRGRWHTDQSVRRYGKVGKIQEMMTDLSPERMAFCQWSLRNIERVLKGTLPPRLP